MKKEEERNIYAVFDDKTIRVYQAYNNEIADEALKLGKFGSKFSLTRMKWIKPSFLWMMNWKTFRIKGDYNGRFSEKRRKQYRNTKYWNFKQWKNRKK